MQNRILIILMMLWGSLAYAQMEGLVLDKNTRKPLSDVSISVDGTCTSKTDKLGRFVLPFLALRTEIHFSHLAYVDTIIMIENTAAMENKLILLQSKHRQIDEVIINTGYHRMAKQQLTGAYAIVSEEQLEQQVSKGISAMLPAIASGVMLDNNSDFSGRLMVRGLSSIRGDKKPLIVLDNFPFEGNIDDINPMDIESITVLKDAAASAIWGVRAGNGVIVITTKTGGFSQKTKFSLSTNFKTGAAPNLKRLDIMGSDDFIALEEYLFDNKFYDPKINDYSKPPLSPIVEALIKLNNGEMDQSEYNKLRSKLSLIDVRDGYAKHFFRSTAFQRHYLRAMGGNNVLSWLSSFGYDKELEYNKNKNNRITYRLQNQLKVSSALQFTSDINIIQQEFDDGKPTYGSIKMGATELYPYAEFADANGVPLRISQRRNDYIDEMNKTGLLLDWNYYPLSSFEYLSNTKKQWTINWNLGTKYNIAKFLNLDLKYNLFLLNSNSHDLSDIGSYSVRNMINSFSTIESDGTVEYNIPKGGVLERSNQRQLAHNARAQLNFDQMYGNHAINALFGFEGRINRNNLDADKLYGYNAENLSFANVDYINEFPDFTTGALRKIQNGQYKSESDIRFVSAFANAVYSFKNKYNFSGSLRRDATNLFGVRTNKKWNLLWSLGGSWQVIKGETKFIEDLKLRTTFGYSGNIDPTMAAVNTIKYSGTNTWLNQPVAMFSSYTNPDLKWETIGVFNAGVDVGLWRNRIDISIDWFNKYGNDLFGLDINDPTAGIGRTIVRNVAKMKATGLDLTFNVKAIHTKDWKLMLQANINWSKDKVVEYYLQNMQGYNFLNERAITALKGNPVYSLYSFRWNGLNENGNPIIFLNDEESNDYASVFNNTKIEDMVYGGPVIPRWFGSSGAVFHYKEFSFNFRLLYKLGHSIRTRSIDYTSLLNNNITHSDYSERWQKAGDEFFTDVPIMIYPINNNRDNYYKNAEVLVEPGSHIRLQYINLGYSPSVNSTKKLKYNIFLNIENLGVLWKASGKNLDPDFENTYNAIAPPRYWTFGVKLQF